jgi:hypothetical protein
MDAVKRARPEVEDPNANSASVIGRPFDLARHLREIGLGQKHH